MADAPAELAQDLERKTLDLDKGWSLLEMILRVLDFSREEQCLAAIRGGLPDVNYFCAPTTIRLVQ